MPNASRNLARWVLVLVAPIAVWYCVLLFGLLGIGLLDMLCPPELMVSGLCSAPWHPPAVETLMAVCSGMAAFGMTALPAAIAPRHGRVVAAAIFVLGAAFALRIVILEIDLWPSFLGAAIGGVAGLVVGFRKVRS